MKFGKTLLKNQIPEWSRNYINYKALKKRVNRAAEEYRVGQQQACDDSVAGTEKILVTAMSGFMCLHEIVSEPP